MAEMNDPALLLRHSGWIHALARRLVADPDVAADLAQETLMEALQRPASERQLGSWMAAVLRNKFRKLLRGDAHRREREERASRPEELSSTLDVIERVATHRDVVEAVLALDEPYCRTILLRYFEGLSHREIARRLNVAVPTVNSRITRGLEQLRRHLSSRYGDDRRAFLAALAPLAQPHPGSAALPFGVKLMHAGIAATALGVVAVTVTVGRQADLEIPAGLVTSEVQAQAVPDAELEPFPGAEPVLAPVPAAAADLQRVPVEPLPELLTDPDWEVTLEHSLPLGPAVRRVDVNARAGDIEVYRSTSGQIEIKAHVRADTKRVSGDQLSRQFSDHVKIEEKGKTVRIEDAHENSNGLNVSFAIGLPQPLSMNLNSGAGDVTVKSFGDDVTANSGAGSVRLIAPEGVVKSVNLNSGAGKVELDVLAVEDSVMANSGAGNVLGRVRRWDSTGSVHLNTGAGKVKLVVSSNVAGSFDVESGLGEVRVPASLGLKVEDKGGAGGMKATGRVGSGGGDYHVNSGVGQAEIGFPEEVSEPL
jgi:RNA polymerase sigma-70 factor (ECF subfamily)